LNIDVVLVAARTSQTVVMGGHVIAAAYVDIADGENQGATLLRRRQYLGLPGSDMWL